MSNIKKLASCGGCVSKLPQGLLKDTISKISALPDANLLVGFDASDDGAVFKLSDDTAIIQTVDFFPPMTDDPYLFGKIAATNALNDIYAMGGKVLLALNVVCFPAEEDPTVLTEILRGGAEKVMEAGGILCGGHSINDREIKYGLSVTGIVRPDKILYNNRCRVGDKIILTKPLGVGMIAANRKIGQVSDESYDLAVSYMQTLNKYAFEIAEKYEIHAATDVTGFGFLGHLNEMAAKNYSIVADSKNILFIPEAARLAGDFLITAGGQTNREYLSGKVKFDNVPEPMKEILFDPQTSGGLLISVAPDDADELLAELNTLDIKSCIAAEVTKRRDAGVIAV